MPDRTEQPSVTVHGLRGGFALCGFAGTVPMNWPAGHYWVDPLLRSNSERYYPHAINCQECKAVIAEEAKTGAKDN